MDDNNKSNRSRLALLLQKRFRGDRARELHVSRARAGAEMVCPFVASSDAVVDCMIRAAHLSEGDVCLDLGCGDGAICLGVGRLQVPGLTICGIDIDGVLCETARRRCHTFRDCVTIEQKDILDVDIQQAKATVVFTFLVPSCMATLAEQKFRNLSAGVRIIAYKFPLPAPWVPTAVLSTEDVLSARGAEVFVYLK